MRVFAVPDIFKLWCKFKKAWMQLHEYWYLGIMLLQLQMFVFLYVSFLFKIELL